MSGNLLLYVTILCCLLGAGLLTAALQPMRFLIQNAGQHGRQWQLLLGLIALFMLGYIGFTIRLVLEREARPEDLIAGIVFLAGGVFVFNVIRLSVATARHLLRLGEEQREAALHDTLTGLPNRALFMERLNRQLALSRRNAQALCVLVMDLDGFKAINDELGHEAGDHLLAALGPRLMASIRESDFVSRMGGDEFAVVLVNCQLEEAGTVAGKVADAVRQPIELYGRALSVGASIGIAACPEHGADAAELLRNADRAMYRSKKTRRPERYRGGETDAVDGSARTQPG